MAAAFKLTLFEKARRQTCRDREDSTIYFRFTILKLIPLLFLVAPDMKDQRSLKEPSFLNEAENLIQVKNMFSLLSDI